MLDQRKEFLPNRMPSKMVRRNLHQMKEEPKCKICNDKGEYFAFHLHLKEKVMIKCRSCEEAKKYEEINK